MDKIKSIFLWNIQFNDLIKLWEKIFLMLQQDEHYKNTTKYKIKI